MRSGQPYSLAAPLSASRLHSNRPPIALSSPPIHNIRRAAPDNNLLNRTVVLRFLPCSPRHQVFFREFGRVNSVLQLASNNPPHLTNHPLADWLPTGWAGLRRWRIPLAGCTQCTPIPHLRRVGARRCPRAPLPFASPPFAPLPPSARERSKETSVARLTALALRPSPPLPADTTSNARMPTQLKKQGATTETQIKSDILCLYLFCRLGGECLWGKDC